MARGQSQYTTNRGWRKTFIWLMSIQVYSGTSFFLNSNDSILENFLDTCGEYAFPLLHRSSFRFNNSSLAMRRFYVDRMELRTTETSLFVSCLFLGCLCLSGQEVNAAQVSFGVAVRGFLYIICRWGSTLIFSIYLYISIIYWGGIIF